MSQTPLPEQEQPHDGPGTAGTERERAVEQEQPVLQSQTQRAMRRFLHHRLAMASLLVFVLITIAAFLAQWIAPYEYDELDLNNVSQPPTFTDSHFFGTDKVGRDYFSRVLHGTRTSVQVAILVAVLSTIIGTVVGAIAGFYSGLVDNVLMRVVDFIMTLPFLAVVLVFAAFLGGGSPIRIAFILGVVMWTTIARIVRGQCLTLREAEYVQAGRVLGAGDLRLMFRHMVPNTMGPIIVNATLVVAQAILLESTMSYLGFGIDPPTPALGKLISDGQSSMLTQWWLVVMPGLTIVILALAVNFIGDGLRDALDPESGEGAE
ncbi:ABC transporter permease [Georgenia halophila]|uniref:Oligopeptide transport system permease protein OppC n=1 Tax=Georgenia halophila TaxID=620889 RepID=A0ABP8LI88_9MICO